MYAAIVFLPIIGSAIAGLLGRVIGNRASELVTTGLLFASLALSLRGLVIALAGRQKKRRQQERHSC